MTLGRDGCQKRKKPARNFRRARDAIVYKKSIPHVSSFSGAQVVCQLPMMRFIGASSFSYAMPGLSFNRLQLGQFFRVEQRYKEET
jgi:hypothetical protein